MNNIGDGQMAPWHGMSSRTMVLGEIKVNLILGGSALTGILNQLILPDWERYYLVEFGPEAEH